MRPSILLYIKKYNKPYNICSEMRRRIIALLVASLTLSMDIAAQKTVNLSTGSVLMDIAETIPTRDVENVSDGIVVTYKFGCVIIQDDPLFEGCSFYRFDGFGLNDIASEAAYPIRMDRITIPKGQAVSVDIVESTYVDFDGEIGPARQPLTDSGDDSYTKDNVQPISPYTGFAPKSFAELLGTQSYRGTSVINVGVYPVQYDFENKKVRVCTTLKYKVTYLDVDAQSDETALPSVSWTSKTNDSFLNNTTLNGNLSSGILKAKSTGTDIAQDYLVISTPEFESAAKRFAEWKKLMGMKPHVVLRNDWTPETIKSVVSDWYSKCGLCYLLIIGDQDDVPGMPLETEINNDTYNYVTDLYYGCMDGEGDYTPDIYRGRVSVSTLDEANSVIDKIIKYEKSPVSNASFYNSGINCAYFQDTDNYDTYADRRFAQTSEEIRDYMMSQGKEVERIYYTKSTVTPKYWNKGQFSFGEEIPLELQKPQFAWNGNASNISSSINKGAFYVLHRDHGAVWGWGSPQYTSSNAASLANGDLLPVVFSMNCLTGRYNEGTCFTESFLRNANGGCVAIFGATELSYSGYNDALVGGMFDAIWSTPGLRPVFPYVSGTGGVKPSPTYCLGQILDQGMARLEETYGTRNSFFGKYTREIFHCFGDPSMQIPTEKPSSFSNVAVTRSSGSVSVSLQEQADRITFYDMLTDEVHSFSGSSATLSTKYPKYVSVCISGHNMIPYINYGTSPSIVFIQNETISKDSSYEADFVKIGSSVTDVKSEGPVYITTGTTGIYGAQNEMYKVG